jgi:hypothetical protein
MKQLFAFVFLGFILLQSSGNSTSDVSNVRTPLKTGHFDHVFFAMDTTQLSEGISQLKKDYPDFFKTEQDDEMLRKRFFDPQIRELFDSVDSTFANTEVLDVEINTAFQYFYHHFPNHDSLKIYTWISNFERLDPILVSRNTLLIALDMYLGAESHFYKTAPDYIKQGFDKDYILSDLFHYYFSANIPFSDNNSLLAAMLHYGKIHYLTSLMLPDYEEHIVMGYPQDKMEWCLGNEASIWAYFIENKLLFSSHQQNKQRFIEDAPFSKFYTSFDTESPGRVGQWIGWNIVRSYMESHPEISLTELIKEQDAQKILRESRYKPKQ